MLPNTYIMYLTVRSNTVVIHPLPYIIYLNTFQSLSCVHYSYHRELKLSVIYIEVHELRICPALIKLARSERKLQLLLAFLLCKTNKVKPSGSDR